MLVPSPTAPPLLTPPLPTILSPSPAPPSSRSSFGLARLPDFVFLLHVLLALLGQGSFLLVGALEAVHLLAQQAFLACLDVGGAILQPCGRG